jgi:uncharacterized protein YutD
MKKIFVILLFAIMCGAYTAHAFEIRFGSSESKMPQWVAIPAVDDADYIYGVGQGDSLAKATQSALSSISGKLATVVSSNISSDISVNQGQVNGYFSEQVRTKTFDTKLSNYEVVKSDNQGDVFYVMIKMSRLAFVKDTMARLKLIDDRLNNTVSQAKKVSRLQHYLALNEIKPDIIEATSLVLLLQAASPTFVSEKYLASYQKHQAMANEMLFQIKFKVDADPKLSDVAEIIIKLLGTEKLSASLSKTGKADAVIAITGSTKNSIIFSEYSTQLRIKIQVTDDSGRKINTKELVVAGSSMTNFDTSKITAANLLEKELENEGAFALLGLQKPL